MPPSSFFDSPLVRARRTPMVELVEVSVRHREKNFALRDVSLRVHRGEFVFVVGTTGSGKSSLLRLLNRELRPTTGEVWVDGQDVGRLRASRVPHLRRKVGMIFQDFRLLPDRTLEENVAFALRVIGVHGKELKSRTWEVMEQVGLAAKGKLHPHQVSGGEQQRAAVARAIVNEPALLLADEPTGNLDPETSRDIIELLETINRAGTTVLIASHDQAIVDRMCRRVIELQNGCVMRDEADGRYEPLPTMFEERELRELERRGRSPEALRMVVPRVEGLRDAR